VPPPNATASAEPGPAPAEPAQRYAKTPAAVPVFDDPERRTRLLALVPRLDAHFAQHAAHAQIPGLAVGLVVDGELAWSRGYGMRDTVSRTPVDLDTLFRLASLTKSFTSMAVLELRDEGKLSLDAPADRYVPELAGLVYPTRDAARITVRNLLTHTAGLPRDAPPIPGGAHHASEAELLGSLQGLPLEQPPGTTYAYSNLGFHLLGTIVSRVSGIPFADFLASRVLRPLGLTSTSFEPAPDRLAMGYVLRGETLDHPVLVDAGPSPAGGLFSSVRDLARYAAFQLSAWPPRDDADDGPLRRSSVREAQRIATWDTTRGYGFGWVAEHTCEWGATVSHNGALTDGYMSTVLLLPDRGVAMVALANVFDDRAQLEKAVRDGMHLLDDSGALAPRVLPPTPAQLAVRDAAMALRDRWDASAARQTFDDSNGFLATLRKGLAEDRDAHGACHVTATTVQSATRFSWDTECDRGGEEWHVAIDGRRGLVTSIVGDDRFPPDPRLTEVAPVLAGLVGRWEDRIFRAHAAPTLELASTRRAFASGAAEHGRCKVERARDQADKLRGRFVLTCARGGSLQMDVRLDDRSGRVDSITLGPPPPAKKCP
jgi:CubicO group peptidase (beta-lactamase class C family)